MLAKNVDPNTSHEAAQYIEETGQRQKNMELVYLALYKSNWIIPPTAAELAKSSGLDRYEVSRRLPDLEKRGFVEKDYARRCTVGGRKSVTWRIAGECQQ